MMHDMMIERILLHIFSTPDVETVMTLLHVAVLFALWRIFEKAGEAGWKALIPLYNIFKAYELVWGSGWKALWLLLPGADVVVHFLTHIKMAHQFGKSTGFGIAMSFFGSICLLYLAFSDAEFHPAGKAADPHASYTNDRSYNEQPYYNDLVGPDSY